MPLQHRHGYAAGIHRGLPTGDINQPRSSPPGYAVRVRVANQPRSTRFELVVRLRGVQSLVPHVRLSVLLAGPRPSGSAGLSRRCQGCLPPSPSSQGSGCPQLLPARCDEPEAVSFHHRTVQQRLVALVGVGPGRPASLSAGGFPWPALRTGHAISTASGSPRVHAAGTGDPSTIGAASSASRVPGTRPRRGRATDRRYSPANSPVCFVAANTLDPSPCDRLSRPRTTTGPPPHPGSISRRRAFPPTSRLLAGEGTAGMVPTFTVEPFDGVGAQLCPCNIATATPQAFTVASRPATSTGQGVPHTAGPCGCALLTSPDLPGLSWWCA